MLEAPNMAYASTQEPNLATIVARPGRQGRVDKGESCKVTYFGPWLVFLNYFFVFFLQIYSDPQVR